jgi:hypothetical protein
MRILVSFSVALGVLVFPLTGWGQQQERSVWDGGRIIELKEPLKSRLPFLQPAFGEMMLKLQQTTMESGVRAPTKQFPFPTSLTAPPSLANRPTGISYPWAEHLCMGVRARANVIVTAKHCLKLALSGLAFGSDDIYAKEAIKDEFTAQYCHPTVDLGIVITKSSVAATLVAAPAAHKVDTKAIALGWGVQRYSAFGMVATSSLELMQAEMKVVSSAAACSITGTQICAMDDNQGPCARDSGGPLVDTAGKWIGVLTDATGGCQNRSTGDILVGFYQTAIEADSFVANVLAASAAERKQKYSCNFTTP